MIFMAWGIIVYGSAGCFYPFVMADDSLYESEVRNRSGNGMNFVAGKKGIRHDNIDNICKELSNLVEKVNNGKFSLDKAKKKLEIILNHK